MIDYRTVLDAFSAALRERGIDPGGDLVADGTLQRCGTVEKPRAKDAAYILHMDSTRPAGGFQNFRDGAGWQNWAFEGEAKIDREAMARHNAEVALKRSAREAKRAREQEVAEGVAQRLWDAAGPVTEHAYLGRKRVRPHGLRQDGDRLLVPGRDATGKLRTLQTIDADGGKLFVKGTSTAGAYHAIGGRPASDDTVLCVCEGYATGASIHEATRWPVAVAFDCGNLKPVVAALRAKYPDARIVVCCDDDYKQKLKNPGRVKGEEAAGAFGGIAVWPVWPEGYGNRGSDFNDLAVTLGLSAVAEQITRALAPKAKPAAQDKPAKPEGPTVPLGQLFASADAPTGGEEAAAIAAAERAEFGVSTLEDYSLGTGPGDTPAIFRAAERDGEPVKILVCSPPVYVCGVSVDVDTSEYAVRVTWTDATGRRELEMPQSQTHNSRLIVSAAAYGLPVSTGNATEFVAYMCAAEQDYAKRRGVTRTTRRMGWHGQSFLRGPHPHQSPFDQAPLPSLRIGDVGTANYVRFIRSRGSLEGWIAAVRPALETCHPLRLFMAATAVSPLLAIIGDELDPFVCDAVSPTSRGKTTAMRVCASLWGDPDRLMQSWAITRTALDRLCGSLNGFPLLLNESQRGPLSHPEKFSEMIYDITARIGKSRGAGASGGLQRQEEYQSVTISNGENALAELTKHGGIKARCLTYWGSPWGATNDAMRVFAENTQRGVFEHHGHAGHAICDFLTRLSESDRGQIRIAWRQEADRFTTLGQETYPSHPVAPRLALYAAACSVAGQVITAATGLAIPKADWVTREVWLRCLERSASADRGAAALEDLISWMAADPSEWSQWGAASTASGEKPGPRGWAGAVKRDGDRFVHIAMVPTRLNEYLTARGYVPDSTLSTWADRQWIETETSAGARRTDVKRSVGGRATRAVTLTPKGVAEINQLLGDDMAAVHSLPTPGYVATGSDPY